MDAPVGRSAPAKRSRNAKRSSLACVSCKRMKRRCDISQQQTDSQSCSNCKDRGAYCEVRYGEDKRRKRAMEGGPDIESRLSVLEDLLVRSNLDQRSSKSTDPDDSDNLQISTDRYEEVQSGPSIGNNNNHDSTTPTGSFIEPLAAVQPVKPAEANQHCQISWSGVKPIIATNSVSGTEDKSSNSPGRFSTASTIPSAATQIDDSGGIIERVVSRKGALEGQSPDNIRYFGPTSIYHLSTATGAQDINKHGFQTTTPVSITPWANIPPEYDPSNEPEALILYLIDLFGTWQASHLQIFHRELFLEEKKLYDTDKTRRRYEFFSPSLLYAIMALASMVSLDRGTRYQSTALGHSPGNIYFNKAKKLFQLEMDDPSITTVQTALLLGSHYGASGYQSPGWTYSGIALRMAVDLGLHISCDAAVAQGQLSPQVAQLRKIVFWGCYVQDKLWSAYCGRPSFIMDWDITISRPERPSGFGDHTLDREAVQAAVHWNIVLLSVQVSKILGDLYSQKHSGNQRKLGEAAAAIHGDLLKWHDELPDALKWPNESGSPTSPHVLLMHMQFYFTLLLLHRPFINFSQDVGRINQLDVIPLSPASICNLAATNITKLSRDYSLSYNLRQIPSPAVHFIFIAATIHLINYRVSGDGSDELLFQGCLSSLAEIGQSYPTGQKAVTVLQDLICQLQLPHNLHSNGNASSQTQPPYHESETRPSPASVGAGLNRSKSNITDATRRHSLSTYETAEVSQRNEKSNLANTDRGPVGDPMHWVTDPGDFDWSNLNSPITFPPELDDINLNSIDKSSEHIPVESYHFFDSWPVVPAPGFGDANGFISVPDDLMEVGSRPETSVEFLGRYYGTAFGLQRNV